MNTFQTLSPRDAYAAYMAGSTVVDVRSKNETEEKVADLKRLLKIPFEELGQRLGELPANRPVVLVSRVGVKGKEAAQLLVEHGLQNVALVDGGITAWEADGLPIR
jgi:rhodanese-related sulfurtransferase